MGPAVTDHSSYRRLAALAHAGRQLAAASSRDDAIAMIADVGLEALSGDSATIGRVEHEHGLLRILRNVGDLASWEDQLPRDETYRLADFPQLSASPGRAVAWSGSIEEPGLPPAIQALLRALGKRSLILVPLVVDGAVWGMFSVVRAHAQEPFDAEDLALGEALGGLLGATLGRIEDRNELHDLAYRDALTGLGNRRAVDDRLEAVFDQVPLRSPVAVVLCDVNGLKAVNDDYGHHAGDRLLQDVALLLSAEAGSLPGALAARLGGDEFCLVIEGLEPASLDEITVRLREHAASLRLGDGLSCGWALATKRPGSAPTAVAAARALLRLADAAQYRVKRHGRDAPSSPTAQGRERDLPAELVGEALARLQGAGPTVLDRLSAVSTAVFDLTNAAAWAVSLSVDGGPITIVRNLDRPRHTRTDNDAFVPGEQFPLDDYPATREALRGGSFHASLISGDEAERGFLAAAGYVELIAAGRSNGPDGWLVEICADALSAPLLDLEPLLRLLVELAVTVPEHELSRPRTVGNSV
jgi:diguanylate cyclase (GGDEF)-like protein